MSIFGTIMSKIFGAGHADAAPSGGAPTPADKGASPAPSDGTTAPSGPSKGNETPTPPAAQQEAAAAPPTAPAAVDVAEVLDGMEATAGQKLDWRHSIVDLMKLLHLDSSLSARKELAHELHYSGDTNDSAAMNIWLHKEVMTKLAENGGKVPPDLH